MAFIYNCWRRTLSNLTLRSLRFVRQAWSSESPNCASATNPVQYTGNHERFLSDRTCAVPGLLIYDQPSQVYFPKRTGRVRDDADERWKDEDVEAVRKVFALLADETERAKGRLQIIVLDHAHEEVWGKLPGVKLVDEWRGGKKLVPVDW